MILAGDIGGTSTRLAFFEGTPDRLLPVRIEIFPSAQFSGLAEIVGKFLASHPHAVDAVCFGLPGAVVNGRVETTNLPWLVDARQMVVRQAAGKLDPAQKETNSAPQAGRKKPIGGA